MFLNFWKNLFTKKIVKNSLSNVSCPEGAAKVQKIGILVDESAFHEIPKLTQALVEEGILQNNIRLLVYKNSIGKKEISEYPAFCDADLSWTATFSKSEVKDFISEKFDLLINYYDNPKSALLVVSNQSKAIFKSGFTSSEKKINHFMVDTTVENYTIFVQELFKYLKILNKI